jgi:LmbE family N-acetylglucosaminyl deacetylase
MTTATPPAGELDALQKRRRKDRACVTIVAPHPDDEIFGVGGLMRCLVDRGRRLRLVAVTDGEAAFGSPDIGDQNLLARRRRIERDAALEALGVRRHVEIVSLGVPDGAVAAHEEDLARMLAGLLSPQVLTTWRHDGHPDHEATARATAAAVAVCNARLAEFPIWAHHRGRWSTQAARCARRVRLPCLIREAKWRAIAAFESQLAPSPDGRPVVSAELVARLRFADEFLIESPTP